MMTSGSGFYYFAGFRQTPKLLILIRFVTLLKTLRNMKSVVQNKVYNEAANCKFALDVAFPFALLLTIEKQNDLPKNPLFKVFDGG